MRGKFITFEGGEGAGKSTQITFLKETLLAQGHRVVQTREPGGTKNSEILRELILHPPERIWSSMTELLLHLASRHEHIENFIEPALQDGHWVLCDRYIDSTIAYQGYGKGIDVILIRKLNALIQHDLNPDLTFIFDIPVEVGLSRAQMRGTSDTYESMDISFHQNLRKGFIEIAQNDPNRCYIVDGSAEIDNVRENILKKTEQHFGL